MEWISGAGNITTILVFVLSVAIGAWRIGQKIDSLILGQRGVLDTAVNIGKELSSEIEDARKRGSAEHDQMLKALERIGDSVIASERHTSTEHTKIVEVLASVGTKQDVVMSKLVG